MHWVPEPAASLPTINSGRRKLSHTVQYKWKKLLLYIMFSSLRIVCKQTNPQGLRQYYSLGLFTELPIKMFMVPFCSKILHVNTSAFLPRQGKSYLLATPEEKIQEDLYSSVQSCKMQTRSFIHIKKITVCLSVHPLMLFQFLVDAKLPDSLYISN